VPPDAGVTAFLDEIRYGRKGESHVLLGAGPWCVPRDVPPPAPQPRPERVGDPALVAGGGVS
jgi:hypothetical protein